jgi:hypothetical protein
MRFKKGFFRTALITLTPLALTIITLSACSSGALLGSLKLGLIPQLAGNALSLSSGLNLGNLVLGNLQTPILDPITRNLIGNLTLGSTGSLPGQLQNILLNLNPGAALSGSTELGMTLPNGKPLPTELGVSPGELRGIPLLDQSRVYVGTDSKGRSIVGVALTLRELDSVSALMPLASNNFIPRSMPGSTLGLAGIYLSPVPGQSGIAVFGVKNSVPSTQGTSPTSSAQLAQKESIPSLSQSMQQSSLNGAQRSALLKLFYGRQRKILPR